MALSALQWQFLAARLLSATDKEAAAKVDIDQARVSDWKRESADFAREYQAAFSDGVHVAQEYTRKLLGKAAARLDEALDATRTVQAELKVEFFGSKNKTYVAITEPDHKARLEAIKILFQSHGLLKERVDIEIRVRQVAEQMGLDPDAAVEEAKRIVSVAGTRRS